MAEKGLAGIVGGGNVLLETGVLDGYSRDASFLSGARPRCVVRPGNATEVQAIVKWAGEAQTPLVPVSSGPPHARGDTVPGVDGAVIIDLSRMKKIIRIDPCNKVAMVEPGVTFAELQPALAKEGLCAYMPLAPRAGKSVIGSVLEREPVTMPSHHWDSTDPLLCAEVVYGTGDRFRTGEASGPDTVEEQWEMGRVQLNPFGHSHIDFQRFLSGAQGTMGIVTWATLKCCYLSRLTRAWLVPSEGLGSLIDLAYRLLRFRLGGKLFILNATNLACLLDIDAADIKRRLAVLPPWVLFASFEGYGTLPVEKAAYEEADFLRMANEVGLSPQIAIPGASAEELLPLLSGPSPEPYWKSRARGGFQDIFFLSTSDRVPEFCTIISNLAERNRYAPEDIGVYLQPIVQGTACHCEFTLYYHPDKALESDATRLLMDAACEQILASGGFFSRPYPAWKKIAYRRAASTAAIQKKLKQIFDPEGILNPGKLCF
ncbi:MAG: hypothetical protein A2Z29_06665 [Chloroflexi bacterium RBG_16_56_11]|nr:MAG: hypothetical protein A2Z29_06665 [Chloroflexi bacterium RBG_16_56_11]